MFKEYLAVVDPGRFKLVGSGCGFCGGMDISNEDSEDEMKDAWCQVSTLNQFLLDGKPLVVITSRCETKSSISFHRYCPYVRRSYSAVQISRKFRVVKEIQKKKR